MRKKMNVAWSDSYIIDDPLEVEYAIAKLGLSVKGLIAVRDAAYTHILEASPLDALSAAGLRSYLSSVATLREQFLDAGWKMSRDNNIETILNVEKKVKVGYQNVDRACVGVLCPQPKSRKGIASERQCQPNLFDICGVVLPQFNRIPT